MKEKLTHFRIGQIVNTQGLKGEVRVYPYVDDINRFDDLESFYLNKNFNEEFEVERVDTETGFVYLKDFVKKTPFNPVELIRTYTKKISEE